MSLKDRMAAVDWRKQANHLVLPCSLFAMELAFKALTTGSFLPETAFLALFSAALGCVLELFVSLLPSAKVRHAVRSAILTFLGIIFLVELFVYRAFKLFYDPVTVLSGAGDVAAHFGGSVASLVFSPAGLGSIALFLAPALAYIALVVKRQHTVQAPIATDSQPKPKKWLLLALGAASILSFACALMLAFALGHPWRILTDRYSFQHSVSYFGLMPSLGKEAEIALGGSDVSFEEVPKRDVKTDVDTKTDKAKSKRRKKKVDTSPNKLDIDFEALAQKTDGTWADLDHYVATLEPSSKNKMTGIFKGKNLIFISAEAFSAEAIRKDTTPTLWRMWNEGIQLTDYYQFDTAGTTGGECANIFGLLATEGGSSVKMTADYDNRMTMGALLDAQGYEGWAFHNNTYTYYGRDTTHNNLGYNHGYMGYGNGMEQWVTWQWPQSDLEMVKGTFKKLYGKATPFNVYYMSVSGHSDYDPGENAMAQKWWDVVKDLPYSDRVKGYLAANVDLDRAMKWLLAALEKRGIADDTVIVISADHFPYGLDDDGPLGQLPYLSELYGYDVETIFQRDHNRPIIWCGSLAKKDPIVVDTPTISIDLLPTLCNLFGVEWDSRLLPGRDVFSEKDPLVFDLNYDWKTELGTYYASSGTFEPVEGATIPKGYVEQVSADVANRITYCHGVLTTDYYRHVFGD